MVKINGEIMDVQGKSLLEYLTEAGYQPEQIAVECNGEIIPKAMYAEKILEDGDVLEVVRFVGGG